MATELELSAYHEAGHAVIAIMFSQRVLKMSIAENIAVSAIHYGYSNKFIANVFEYSLYKHQNKAIRKLDSIFLDALIMIMIAGNIAENHYSNPVSTIVELSDSGMAEDDMQRIKNIFEYAKDYNIVHKYQDINGYTCMVFITLVSSDNWSKVEKLANTLIEKKYLDEQEIQQIIG